jgi:diguanylate cyclase (GGDEF)-like protein
LEQETFGESLDPTYITKAELFNNILGNGYEYIMERSSIINLDKNDKLFTVGQKAEHFYMLLKGAVRIFKLRDEWGDDELAQYEKGDLIGDFDFARKASYDANAEAVENSSLIMFPALGITMKDLILEEPHIAARILLNCIIMMTNRIKSSHRLLLENLSWVNELHRRVYEDPGTGLWKQIFLTDEINRILEEPMALILLKPDCFKILVDSRGHEAGDVAMVQIAMLLKNIVRKLGRGWAMRFKSNETGLVINKCPLSLAEELAGELSAEVKALKPVPAQGAIPAFSFSGTIAYSVWPEDGEVWENLFQETYSLMLETWKEGGGGTISRITRPASVKGKSV